MRPNAFELVEQRLQDAPLARAAGDQVDDDDRVALLAIAVDAAHALFEPRRVPRHVVVHHQPAELEVDAFAGGVGRHQIRGAAPVRRPPERGDLRFPRAVVEAAVDQGDPAGEAQPFEPADEEFRGVAVLGEDDEFLAGEVGRAHDGAEFLEFGVLAGVGQAARLIGKGLHRGAFLPEVGQRQRDEAAQGVRLELLVAFASRVVGIFVRCAVFEEVGRAAQPSLPAIQFVRAAGAHQFDGVVQAFQATFERAPQRMGRTGLAALEHAHGQPRRGAVEDAGLVVRVRDVAGRGRVQALLRGAQHIAQGVAPALRIEGAAVEADHFFFGAADEVVAPPGGRKRLERLEGRQRVRHEQPPQAVIGEVLAHVRRRGQQQDVRGRPAQLPPRVVRGESGERLGEPVAVGLADGEVRLAVGGQFVGLVEHDEVVGPGGPGGAGLAQAGERPLPGQGIDADDHAVAVRSGEGVAGAGVVPAHDAERQAEQGAHFAFPVADQPGRRHDEHARHQTTRERLAQVEAGHDRLAGAGVVGQQEAERRPPEQVLVHGDALVRQRVDRRNLRGEGRVE